MEGREEQNKSTIIYAINKATGETKTMTPEEYIEWCTDAILITWGESSDKNYVTWEQLTNVFLEDVLNPMFFKRFGVAVSSNGYKEPDQYTILSETCVRMDQVLWKYRTNYIDNIKTIHLSENDEQRVMLLTLSNKTQIKRKIDEIRNELKERRCGVESK